MDKILSIETMGVWSRSLEQRCVKRLWLRQKCNTSTAQINGAGEIPLIGNGLPLTGYAEGEEIVLSYMKV